MDAPLPGNVKGGKGAAAEKYYDVPFTMDDHKRLSAILKGIKGIFVLSCYDHEFVMDECSGCNIPVKEVSKPSYGMTVNPKNKERPKRGGRY